MTALAVESIRVTFGGCVALDGVSLAVDAGSVTGLIGPNGAGKTTLLNVMTGAVAPDHGTVRLAGTDITSVPTHRRARAGLTSTYQRLELFGSLTVRDNLRVAASIANRRPWHSGGRHGIEPAGIEPAVAGRAADGRAADEVMEMLGIGALAGEPAAMVPTGAARLVELARALMIRPRVLLLDEPAAGQDEFETATFARVLEALAAGGIAVMLIEHDIGLVMAACDRIHVLDLGELIASGTPQQIQRDPAVVAAYLGAGAGTP